MRPVRYPTTGPRTSANRSASLPVSKRARARQLSAAGHNVPRRLRAAHNVCHGLPLDRLSPLGPYLTFRRSETVEGPRTRSRGTQRDE